MRTLRIWTAWPQGDPWGKIPQWDLLDSLCNVATFSHFRRFMQKYNDVAEVTFKPEIFDGHLYWRKIKPRSLINYRLMRIQWVGSKRLRERGRELEWSLALKTLLENQE